MEYICHIQICPENKPIFKNKEAKIKTSVTRKKTQDKSNPEQSLPQEKIKFSFKKDLINQRIDLSLWIKKKINKISWEALFQYREKKKNIDHVINSNPIHVKKNVFLEKKKVINLISKKKNEENAQEINIVFLFFFFKKKKRFFFLEKKRKINN